MVSSVVEVLKIVVFTSVLFVWLVRYQNIIAEFRKYNYPDWLRDLVGILKISFVIMIVSKDSFLIQLGASGIALLMTAAFITHLKVGSRLALMLPSLFLLCCSCLIFYFN